MGKVCAAPYCENRRNRNVTKRKKEGSRAISLFAVPKCSMARDTWSKIIGFPLTERQFLCEAHFKSGDIIRKTSIVFPTGIETTVERKRCDLRMNAIPLSSIEHQEPATVMEISEMTIAENMNIGQLEAEVERNDFPPVEVPNSTNNANLTMEASHLADDLSVAGPYNVMRDDKVLTDYTETAIEPKVPVVPTFKIQDIVRHLKRYSLRETWSWMINPQKDDAIIFTQVDRYTRQTRIQLDVDSALSIKLRTGDGKVCRDSELRVGSIVELEIGLEYFENIKSCSGTGLETNRRSEHCTGLTDSGQSSKTVHEYRCPACRKYRKQHQDRLYHRKKNIGARYVRAKYILDLEHRKTKRLRRRVEDLRFKLYESQEKCAVVEEQALSAAISTLPPPQQEAVKACFKTAKVSHATQRRYTADWLYECVLMRIKDSKLYEHIRTHNILPLPRKETLDKYTGKLKSSYGFQDAVFECLKKKASGMELAEKCGTLLVDEMALSPAINFDQKTLQFNGFVDLGEYTTTAQQNTRADHALVFMFQPFRGKWVQTLGAFLSKDSVTSRALHKLIIECVLLLGNSGFHVDVVTMDGAQWNRGVWTILGIKDGFFSCKHPCDQEKRLWMFSDFPHLIKNLRTAIMNLIMFWGFAWLTDVISNDIPGLSQTPYGTVRTAHWGALLQYEKYLKPNLKIGYKLTRAHVNPQGYEKMRVPLAFELFAHSIQVAMEIFKDDPRYPLLHDSEPTIKFCKLVDDLISAMMSRTPADALRPEKTSKQYKAIEEFDKFIREWEAGYKSKKGFPVSASTTNGLKVTLGGTLELVTYLRVERNFEYLMTSRLNQDALERFFGMMRYSCGSNDHPDPMLFIQVYRLLCTYSLVKPTKGSNVTGTDLLETLMKTKDSVAEDTVSKKQWREKITSVVQSHADAIEKPWPSSSCDVDSHVIPRQSQHLSCHDYDVTKTSEEVQSYIAGYVAKQMSRHTKCLDCVASLKSLVPQPRDIVIEKMNKYDGLTYPSDKLLWLTGVLEDAVLQTVGTMTVKLDTLNDILQKVSEVEALPLVGCKIHEKELTSRVINYYLVMRGHFLARSINENNNERSKKSKQNRKQSKL